MSGEKQGAAQQILEIVPLVMRTVAAELRRTGHTLSPSHFGVLMMLTERPHSLSELAEKQSVSRPSMSNTVTHLVERGWVRRTRAAHDRRMVRVELAPAGRAALDDMRRQAETRVAELLAQLSESECTTLLHGLAVLQRTFSQAADRLTLAPDTKPT